MALGDGSLLEIALNMTWAAQRVMNIWTYEITEQPGPDFTDGLALSEAWWNHVKAAYRALALNNQPAVFNSVRLTELNVAGGILSEWPIPAGESLGTRTPPTAAQILPTFNALGVRLSVPTRATRPGQKRFSFLVEEDNVNGSAGAPYLALINTLMAAASGSITLGAPAALTVMRCIVPSRNDDGDVVSHQAVSGFVINSVITSQTTRRFGRGS